MPPTAIHTSSRTAGSCRGCPVGCDRVVHPGGCLAAACPRLYTYTEAGRTWAGCMEGVYAVEVDLEAVRRAERTRAGFGALKTRREPLPICRSEVERTFAHRADAACVNPDFLLSAPRRPYVVTVGVPEPEAR